MSISTVPNDFIQQYSQSIFDSIGLLKDGVQMSDIPPIVTAVMSLAKKVPSLDGQKKKEVVIATFRLMTAECSDEIKAMVDTILPFAIDSAYYANVEFFKSVESSSCCCFR